MRDDHQEFLDAGARIVAVAPHGLEEVREHWQDNDLPYTGIADPEHVIADRFGQQWKWWKLGRMPAQLVIDCRGRVVFAHYGSGMSDIPANEEMLRIVGSLESCAEAGEQQEPRSDGTGKRARPNSR